MNRRERLMATLMGHIVDRPPVSFYELNGLDENPDDPDSYNIYTHPSWQSLIELTREKTDRIVMRSVPFINQPSDPLDELTTTNSYTNIEGYRFTCQTIRFGKMTLTSLTRRDKDVNTIWNIEHLIKNFTPLSRLRERGGGEGARRSARSVDMSERTARRVISALIAKRLLVSGSHNAPLRLGFAIEAVER